MQSRADNSLLSPVAPEGRALRLARSAPGAMQGSIPPQVPRSLRGVLCGASSLGSQSALQALPIILCQADWPGTTESSIASRVGFRELPGVWNLRILTRPRQIRLKRRGQLCCPRANRRPVPQVACRLLTGEPIDREAQLRRVVLAAEHFKRDRSRGSIEFGRPTVERRGLTS